MTSPSPTAPGSEARARVTDPDTSHAAARSIDNLNERQRAVWLALSLYGPCIDEHLVEQYQQTAAVRGWPPQTESSIRSRRSELVGFGHVVYDNRKQPTKTGKRLARVWRCTDASLDAATRHRSEAPA